METTLRDAGPSDRPLLLTLIRGLYDCEHIPFDAARVGAALDDLMADPALGRAWIAEQGGVAVGYAVLTLGYSLEFGGRFALLDELFVEERHRGAGVGRQVLDRIAETCRALGLRALRLEVERSNRVARELYRKAGFETQDRDFLTLRLG
jgi:GNAT superfamily N-acetyltransferase